MAASWHAGILLFPVRGFLYPVRGVLAVSIRVSWVAVALSAILWLLIGVLASCAYAGPIPDDAYKWRRQLTREAQAQWGINTPVADFAAQIHQESAWRPNARSRVGAYGLSQFMPATATWIAGAYPELGPEPQPASPAWAIRALVTYDKHIWDRVRAATPCDRFAKALAAYNGGETRLHREEKMAAADGLDPMLYFGTVERYNAGRSKANFRENRQYPVKILFRLSPIYQRADWGPTICDDF